jgi:hypothetical protein
MAKSRGLPADPVALARALAGLDDMKKGGVVRKTGLYRLHKGERVTPAKPHASSASSAKARRAPSAARPAARRPR